MAAMGYRTFAEMIGQMQMLDVRQLVDHWKARGLDFSRLFTKPDVPASVAIFNCEEQDLSLIHIYPGSVDWGREWSPEATKLRREQFLHFVDEFAQVDGLGKHLGVLGRGRIGIERDRGEAGDEHDLDVGIELGRATSQFYPVHFRHDDIGEQELERLLAQPLIGGQAVIVGNDLETGILQRLHQEAPHVDVVFRKQNFGHIA